MSDSDDDFIFDVFTISKLQAIEGSVDILGIIGEVGIFGYSTLCAGMIITFLSFHVAVGAIINHRKVSMVFSFSSTLSGLTFNI